MSTRYLPISIPVSLSLPFPTLFWKGLKAQPGMFPLKPEIGSAEILNFLRKETLGDSNSLHKRILDETNDLPSDFSI